MPGGVIADMSLSGRRCSRRCRCTTHRFIVDPEDWPPARTRVEVCPARALRPASAPLAGACKIKRCGFHAARASNAARRRRDVIGSSPISTPSGTGVDCIGDRRRRTDCATLTVALLAEERER